MTVEVMEVARTAKSVACQRTKVLVPTKTISARFLTEITMVEMEMAVTTMVVTVTVEVVTVTVEMVVMVEMAVTTMVVMVEVTAISVVCLKNKSSLS